MRHSCVQAGGALSIGSDRIAAYAEERHREADGLVAETHGEREQEVGLALLHKPEARPDSFQLAVQTIHGSAQSVGCPGAGVGGAGPVPVQMWAAVIPVPAQMWQG